MKNSILVFLFNLIFVTHIFSQVTAPGDQIRKEIVARGMDLPTVENKLSGRGVNLNQLDPARMAEYQSIAADIMDEMEKEKAAEKNEINIIVNGKGTQNEAKKADTKTDVTGSSTNKPILDKVDNLEAKESTGKFTGKETTNEAEIAPLPAAATSSIYGHHLFKGGGLELYKTTNDINIPDSYVIGPGDKLAISLWGIAFYNEYMEVNGDGFVTPASIGRIYLKDLTFAKAKKQLEVAFKQRYSFPPNNFAVTMQFVRTLNVNIVGEVMNAGTFKLSALNNAFHALMASAGPTEIGSVRSIMLYRSKEQAKKIDLYEYLLNPTIADDYFLSENDNIFIPIAERVVEIKGAINRPYKYELTKGENLIKLLQWSGGLREDAYLDNIQISRYVNQKRVILDINLKEIIDNNREYTLLDGDIITIKEIPTPVENFVNIGGGVELPDQYQISDKMTLVDLLKISVLKKEARTDFAALVRYKNDGTVDYLTLNLDEALKNPNSSSNIMLRPKDKVNVFLKSRYIDNASISSEGFFREPTVQEFDPAKTINISTLVELSGGLKPEATDFAYIFRKYPNNPKEQTYLKINLKEIIDNPKSKNNLNLEPFDRLVALSKANYKDQYVVELRGAVRNPDSYIYDSSLKLSDMFILAGGLKIEAAANKVEVFRLKIEQNESTQTVVGSFAIDSNYNVIGADNFKLQPFDVVIVRNVPEFSLQRFVQIIGEVKYPGDYALIDKNEKLLNLISRAGGLTLESFPDGATLKRSEENLGDVILDLKTAIKNPNDRHNFILKQGDVLFIPKSKELVTIIGLTNASERYNDQYGKINVAFNPGKRALYYVKYYAAGVGAEGSRKSIIVRHPNGELKRTKNFGLFKIYPKVRKGTVIEVGPKKKKKEKSENGIEDKKTDWEQVAAETIAKAVSLITLIVLLRQL
jgi:protein involved in polysaccharide export with SLBB domain